MKYDLDKAIVCLVGLGYVGLPLAEAFAKRVEVIGFDVDADKIRKLNQNNSNQNLVFTGAAKEISRADFVIICVPTPLTKSKEPDLSYITSAAETIGRNMKKGSVVILESTVYPGVTEEIVKPILEEESGLKCGEGFKIAYSPERINPGDEEHTIDKTAKVVAGMDEETTELVAKLYEKVISHIFKAKDIRTAEAAKAIENIQRDLNIALMNELSLIFDKMGLSTKDVLEAASTKWNFHSYSPGLVGGHCIPVDPYYLVYKAEELGYHPQVILAGRAINDSMPKHIADMTVRALNDVGKVIKGSKVLIMGLTYKENVADVRETPAKEIIRELRDYGIEVFGHDPVLDDVEAELEVEAIRVLDEAPKVDGIILAVAHKAFREIPLSELRAITSAQPVLIDVRGMFDEERAIEKGFYYRKL
jgi:UDPglucose 6-dehydrogenase/UDP-N-acetyl-D-galactosamine dehydrogenase